MVFISKGIVQNILYNFMAELNYYYLCNKCVFFVKNTYKDCPL